MFVSLAPRVKKLSNVTWTAYYLGPLFRRALDILLKIKPIYIYIYMVSTPTSLCES